jgi:hypothetical protein
MGYGASPDKSTPFSFKPDICLNRTDKNLRGDKFSSFKISFNLASPSVAMYTTGGGILNYSIQNLKLSYFVEDLDNRSQGMVKMKVVNLVKTSLTSNNSTIEYLLPTQTKGIVSSVARNLSLQTKKQAIDYIPISLLRFMYNDSNNRLVSFDLKNDAEILHLYTQTMRDGNQLDSLMLAPPTTQYIDFGFGLKVDIPANQKISMLLQSDTGANASTLFTYIVGEIMV